MSLLFQIWKKIVESGKGLATKERSDFTLMYEWHEKKYLGAAHGLAGILYILMQYVQNKPDVRLIFFDCTQNMYIYVKGTFLIMKTPPISGV